MDSFDIPIFKKTYELYKTCYSLRASVPKQDRYALWQQCENLVLEILEGVLLASQSSKPNKQTILEKVSLKINVLRVFFRLAKDVRAIDQKKYLQLQEVLDEIGPMLGGWIKSTKEII